MSKRMILGVILAAALPALPGWGNERGAGMEEAAGPVGLEALIRLVQQRDPELAARRREAIEVDAEGTRDLRPRDPEIRIGYASSSHAAVPDPYTETREETITRQETRSTQTALTGSERDRERRTDTSPVPGDPLQPNASELRTSSATFSERERESETASSTLRRTRVREVIPGRRSTTTRETIYESGRESFREDATRSQRLAGAERQDPGQSVPPGGDPNDFAATQFRFDGSSDRSISARGVETSRAVEQRIEEEVYGRDPYEGSDDYWIELRLYPSHPFQQRAIRERARADVRVTEQEAEIRAQEIAHEVRTLFVELQLLDRETRLLESRIDALNREVALRRGLFETGQTGFDRYADSQVDAIDARLDRDAIRVEADALRDLLAARAGLADPGRIALDGEIAALRDLPADLDTDRLVDAAWQHRRELGRLAAEDDRLAQDLARARAERIPWLNLISGRYTYEERYGDKYRDEYSVMAGVTVPVFPWFGGERALLRRSREYLARDIEVLRRQIELDVTHALRRLERTRTDIAAFADEHLAFRAQLQTARDTLPADLVSAREQRLRLDQASVTLQTRELDLTRAHAEAVLALEAVLGTPVPQALQPPPVPDPEGDDDD